MRCNMAYDATKVSEETLNGSATPGQCKALGFHFAAKANGKIDWTKRSRVSATLWSFASKGKLSYEEASLLFEVKKLPKVYADSIKAYLAKNK